MDGDMEGGASEINGTKRHYLRYPTILDRFVRSKQIVERAFAISWTIERITVLIFC